MVPVTKRDQTSDTASWASICALAFGILLIQWSAPLPVEARSLTTLAIACTALSGAAYFYRTIRVRHHFAAMCTALIQILLFSALAAVLSYLLTRGSGPLWDDTFTRWDRALGLDWLGYVEFVDTYRWLAMPLRFAYASLIPQFVVLIVLLGFRNHLDHLRAVVLAGIVCGILTVVISPIFPAVSSYVHLDLTNANFRYVDARPGYLQLADFDALRAGTMVTLRLDTLQGIIAFPSYHAGLSLVMMWGFWLTRVGFVRWPGMTLAAATILATPVDGGHYFVDVFAGLAIAVASIMVARRAVYWSPAFARLTASPFRRSHAASVR